MSRASPIRLQSHPAECGATCLGIILEYHGYNLPLLVLRAACEITRDGATVAQIQAGARSLGHDCRVYKRGLKSLRTAQNPMILHWNLTHFVVLESIDEKYAWINDPAFGRRRLSILDFQKSYTGVCIEVHVSQSTNGSTKEKLSFQAIPSNINSLFTRKSFGLLALFLAALGIVIFMEFAYGVIFKIFYDDVLTYSVFRWGFILSFLGLVFILLRTAFSLGQFSAMCGFVAEQTLIIRRKLLSILYLNNDMLARSFFAGELYARLQELETALPQYLQGRIQIVTDSFMICGCILLSLLVSWQIALLHLTVSLILVFSLWRQRRLVQETSLKMRDTNALYDILISHRTQSFLRFFAMGVQSKFSDSLIPSLNRRLYAHQQMARVLRSHQSLSAVVQNLLPHLSFFIGLYLLTRGVITYGDYFIASILALLAGYHIKSFIEALQTVIESRPLIERAANITQPIPQQVPLAPPPEIDTLAAKNILTVRGLSFGYGHRKLFNNIDLDIVHGTSIAITGESGCGKSTLLMLLAGLNKPNEGYIFYENTVITGPVKAGFVFAEDFYVCGTIDTFFSGKQSPDKSRIKACLIDVEMWSRIGIWVDNKQSELLETQNFSRGEVQRLLLAQALYQESKLVFFDEAFAHLSLEQSRRIIKRLRSRGTTLVLATQRAEIISECDYTIQLRS